MNEWMTEWMFNEPQHENQSAIGCQNKVYACPKYFAVL